MKRPALLLAAAAAAVARYPRALTAPGLWAEDGMEFFQTAYDRPLALGARLVKPYAGALYLYQRAAAELATHAFPLAGAAALFAALALVWQLAPGWWLLSRRGEALPRGKWRLAALALLVLLPNAQETHLCLTNAGWYSPLLVAAIAWTRPPARARARAAEAAVMLLAALTGPLALFVLPLVALARGRAAAKDVRLWAGAVGCAVQLAVLLSSQRLGQGGFAGDYERLLRVLAARHYFAVHAGTGVAARFWPLLTAWRSALNAVPLALLLAWALGRGKSRPAWAIAAGGAAAGLAACLTLDGSLEVFLATPDMGLRYSLPTTWGLAFGELLALARFPAARPRARAVVAAHLLVLAGVAIPGDFVIGGARDTGPAWSDELARALAGAAPGAKVTVPIAPNGWLVTVVAP